METLQELVASIYARGPNTAISWKDHELQALSFIDLFHQVLSYAHGLIHIGLQPGDRIALFSENRHEWLPLSLGINYAGLVDVPRGQDSTQEDIAYILKHSGARAAIVENQQMLDKVKATQPGLEHIFSIEELKDCPNICVLEGEEAPLEGVTPDTTVSIIYTSGTKGRPKGVELTHGNFASNLTAALERIEFTTKDKLISVLPAWHVFERIVKYAALAAGVETFYSTKQHLVRDIQEQQPTVAALAPLFLDKMHSRIMKGLRSEPSYKRLMFRTALKLSAHYQGRSNALTRLFDHLALRPARKKLGNFRFFVSGGAPLKEDADHFFHDLGIEVLEGYGLTETSPVISVRKHGSRAFGTVGPLIKGVEARIIDPETGQTSQEVLIDPGTKKRIYLGFARPGEINVRGPNVMKGYYDDPEATAKVMRNEWFNTQDIGYFDRRGNLVIVDRADDMIVLSTGENIYPAQVEQKLSTSDYIARCVVVGQRWRYLGVLIVPDFENLESCCSQSGIPFDPSDLDALEILGLYKAEVQRLVNGNPEFKPSEHIAEFRLLPEDFQVGRELNPTHKVMRHKVMQLYEEKVRSMHDSIHR